MKLKFEVLDERGTIFEALVATPQEESACAAFDAWCSEWLPAPGEHWSRSEIEGGGAAHARCRRLVVVFGDDALARRFRSVWY